MESWKGNTVPFRRHVDDSAIHVIPDSLIST